jgi:hypothetical protein
MCHAICVEMFGMENTIDDTTELSLFPFVEVLELKTQIKLATIKNLLTPSKNRNALQYLNLHHLGTIKNAKGIKMHVEN